MLPWGFGGADGAGGVGGIGAPESLGAGEVSWGGIGGLGGVGSGMDGAGVGGVSGIDGGSGATGDSSDADGKGLTGLGLLLSSEGAGAALLSEPILPTDGSSIGEVELSDKSGISAGMSLGVVGLLVFGSSDGASGPIEFFLFYCNS